MSLYLTVYIASVLDQKLQALCKLIRHCEMQGRLLRFNSNLAIKLGTSFNQQFQYFGPATLIDKSCY